MSFHRVRRLVKVALEDAWYRQRARRMGITYDEAAVGRRVDGRAVREAVENGRLRIFAAVRHFNWENHNLLPALAKLGEVVHFDWGPEGFPADTKWSREQKAAFNVMLLERFRAALKDGPVHLFFGYLTGFVVTPETVREIGRHGAVTVNISLDDRAKFRSRRKHGVLVGMCGIGSAFDVCWTSTRGACEKYLVEGANPIYLPEGANPDIYHPEEPASAHPAAASFEWDVSFVGQRYGMRPGFIAALERHGIPVATFGQGWPGGPVPVERMVEIYRGSRINLGFGGVGNSSRLVCLKGRDFEIPMCGGLYLTQYNPELEGLYDVGREIVCYRSADDCARTIRRLLDHPEEAARIRAAGRARAAAEHTWDHRFARLMAAITGLPARLPGPVPAAEEARG